MPARSRSKTVLIVEDDPDIREVLEEMIDAGGHAVVTATNGAEGLAALAQVEPPVLVLLDLMMPVMSGWEVIAALVRSPRRPKVIVMSAYCKTGVPAGAVEVVQKPIDVDTLLSTIRRFAGAP